MSPAPFDSRTNCLEGGAPDGDGLHMADFPKLEVSMRDVRRAGDALKGELVWSDAEESAIREVFQIANNWRDAHIYPMAKVRSELIAKVRLFQLRGLTAARVKRMSSIRRKLREIPENLSQMQDLCGCRAILPSIGAVNTLVDAYRAENRYEPKERDYIGKPKAGGYRSHHFVLRFRGAEKTIFDGRKIELQIRTRLQHSWATAVEAVGTFRRENLKGGRGDPDWLRLFALMAGELAAAEKCPMPPDVPTQAERRREIVALNTKLDALASLQNWAHAVRFTEHFWRDPNSTPRYYLIVYDNEKMEVDVKPYFGVIESVTSYESAEQGGNLIESARFNTVLVESSAIDALKIMYPNYFGDVQLFKKNLENIVSGRDAREYTAAPLISEPPPTFRDADISWLRRTGRRKWRPS